MSAIEGEVPVRTNKERLTVDQTPDAPDEAGAGNGGAADSYRFQAQESGKINMVCSHVTRARIEDAARRSGRTLSKEAEHTLERCFVYDDLFERLGETAQELAEKSLHAAFRRHGYNAVRLPGPSSSGHLLFVPHEFEWPPRWGELEGKPTQAAPPAVSLEQATKRIGDLERQIEEMSRLMAQAGIGPRKP